MLANELPARMVSERLCKQQICGRQAGHRDELNETVQCACCETCCVDGVSSDGGAFEKIRGGARPMDDPAGQHARLSLDNKFDALDAEHS